MKINIKEILTLPTYILASMALASGIILIFPESFINYIYMSNFRDKYGFIIGIIFLVTVSVLTINAFSWLLKILRNRWKRKKLYEKGIKRLNNLNNYQKTIVYLLYQEDNRTALLPLHDGAVRELEYYAMIGKVSSIQMVDGINPQISYLLQPWVIQELDKDRELLDSFLRCFS